MKTNKKKVTLLGVALIAAVITLAGVGYAAVGQYNGQTASVQGNMDVDWVVLKLGSDEYVAPEGIEVVWSSNTTGYSNNHYLITYHLEDADELVHHLTKVSTASEATTFKLKASGADFAGNNIYTLRYSIDGGANYIDYKSGDLFGETGITMGDTQNITWTVEASDLSSPQDDSDVTPGTSVTMPAITYTLVASSDP